MGMPVTAARVAPSGQVIAVADGNALLHVMANTEPYSVAPFPVEETADPPAHSKRLATLLGDDNVVAPEVLVDVDQPGATGAFCVQMPTKFAAARARLVPGMPRVATKDQAASFFPECVIANHHRCPSPPPCCSLLTRACSHVRGQVPG